MAKSHYRQEQYPSRDFVESAGAVLFDFRSTGVSVQQLLGRTGHLGGQTQPISQPSIALFHSGPRNQILLPKGRRNINEPRGVAAVRETYEETGLKCRLLPILLHSRATSINPSEDRVNAGGFTVNEARTFHGTTDPFWTTLRRTQDPASDGHVKIIWWYIAVVEDVQDEKSIELDPGCELRLVPVSKAVGACSFEDDGKIVQEAIDVVQETLGTSWTEDGAR